jgi:chemotaxis protein methyltransferase CheR
MPPEIASEFGTEVPGFCASDRPIGNSGPMYIESHAYRAAVTTEFLFTDSDFSRVRTLIHRRAGIALGEQKRQMVYSRLSRRLRELQLPEFTTYLDWLEQRPDGEEWQLFINSLTTNLTSFFREAHHFPTLADHVRKIGQPVTVWCAAASTGEEPYSIAITLMEALGDTARGLARDRDRHRHGGAGEGLHRRVHHRAGAKPLPRAAAPLLQQGHRRSNAGKVRIRPEVAALVKFSRLNLLDISWSVKEPVDAIFCRNVMIYFDKPTQKKMLDRFAPLLKSHGLLFAGHSENASLVNQTFRRWARPCMKWRAPVTSGVSGMSNERRARVPHRVSVASHHYFDRDVGLMAVKLLPSEYYVTSSDTVLSTVLGSCVAACLHDVENGVAGMNHFMLPEDGENTSRRRATPWSRCATAPTRWTC